MLNEEQSKILDSYGKVNTSELEILDAMYVYKINSDYSHLSDIFDNIVPTGEIAFASWNNFSKVSTDTKLISSKWVNESDGIVYLKYRKWQDKYTIDSSYVDDEYIEEDDEDPPFGTIFIQQNEEMGLIAVFQYYDTKKSISLTELEKRVVKAINCKGIKSGTQEDVRGRFNIPSQMMQQYVLLHLITNNEVFSKLLTIDEQKQTKKSHLTLQYKNTTNKFKKIFAFTITQQADIESGEYYVRVNLKGSHQLDTIKEFIIDISKLISMYNKLENDTIDFYKIYGIKPESRPKIIKKKVKSAISNHSRECGHKPAVFENEEEALKYTDNDKTKYIYFPKDGDISVLNDKGDALPSKYYACSDKDRWKYPGLTKNLIPCCYEINQNTKTRTLYKYENSISLTSEKNLTKHILLGYKPLLKGQQGFLPESLDDIFTYFIDEPQQYYKRDCVDVSKNSFIKCISTVLNIGYSDIVSYMVKKPHLAKQELYDYSDEQIIDYIKDDNKYKDPRHLSSLIEELLNVVIITFNDNGIIKPNYKENYYRRVKNKDDTRYIFLYEQQDECMFNICNIITYVDGKDYKFIFSNTDDISKHFEEKLRSQYVSIGLNVPSGWQIMKQSFDTFGKTRILELQDQSTLKSVFVQTSPLQPYSVGVLSTNTITPLSTTKEDFSLVTKLINDFKIPIESKKINYIDKTMSEFVLLVSDNIEFRIPYIASYKVFEQKFDPLVSVATSETNELESYLNNKKISICIMQYSLWLLSKQDKLNIDDFIMKDTIIIPDYDYSSKALTSNFVIKDNVLFKDNKLVMNSYELRRNLKYYLSNTLTRKPNMLLSYKNITHIPGFYNRKDDFKLSPVYYITKNNTDIDKLKI